MKKVIVIISIIISIFIVFFTIIYSFRYLEDRSYKDKGAFLIKKIEKYKLDYGNLPESEEKLNINMSMDEGPYYKKIDSLKYIVYFNIGFDNSFIYSSDTKEWKYTP